MAVEDAWAVVEALADPETLYVFGVIAAGATHVGMQTQPGTRSARYVTMWGVQRQTSLAREVVESAAGRLKAVGLLEVVVDEERGYESWRVSEAGLAAAAGGASGLGARRTRGGPEAAVSAC